MMVVCTFICLYHLILYRFYTVTVGFDSRDGTHPELQRAKALMEVQEKWRRAGITRHYDDEVGAIAMYSRRMCM